MNGFLTHSEQRRLCASQVMHPACYALQEHYDTTPHACAMDEFAHELPNLSTQNRTLGFIAA